MAHAYFSDDILSVIVPVVAYWVTAGVYLRPDARLHTKEEELAANIPSRWTVDKAVVCQQDIQTVFILSFPARPQPSLRAAVLQVACAVVILDAVQYFSHRFMHGNKFWYKHFHSVHHAMVVPYPIGSLYSSQFDVRLPLGHRQWGPGPTLLAGITARTNMYFLVLTNVRSVDLHCGLWLPWSPSHLLFSNNQAFHDSHHQLRGHRCNFSQPFFVAWDKILDTYALHCGEVGRQRVCREVDEGVY